MTREAALAELTGNITDARQEKRDLSFVAKKLEISPDEMAHLLAATPVEHARYPNQMWLHSRLTALKNRLRALRGAGR
jgi:hypothetical protein